MQERARSGPAASAGGGAGLRVEDHASGASAMLDAPMVVPSDENSVVLLPGSETPEVGYEVRAIPVDEQGAASGVFAESGTGANDEAAGGTAGTYRYAGGELAAALDRAQPVEYAGGGVWLLAR